MGSDRSDLILPWMGVLFRPGFFPAPVWHMLHADRDGLETSAYPATLSFNERYILDAFFNLLIVSSFLVFPTRRQ
jgi:hypothetical protein